MLAGHRKAIEEALSARMAGERDIADDEGAPATEDYEDAYEWVLAQLDKRDRRNP